MIRVFVYQDASRANLLGEIKDIKLPILREEFFEITDACGKKIKRKIKESFEIKGRFDGNFSFNKDGHILVYIVIDTPAGEYASDDYIVISAQFHIEIPKTASDNSPFPPKLLAIHQKPIDVRIIHQSGFRLRLPKGIRKQLKIKT